MNKKHPILVGTFILTAAGLLTRFIGFFFRMFLSHTFGEEQVGLYQLIFPIYGICFSLSSAGIETALSRCVAQKISLNKKQEPSYILYQALIISFSLSMLLGLLIRTYASDLSIYILGDLRCEALLSALSYALPFASIHCCFCGYYLGLKQTQIPAASQLVEQIARVSAVYIIYHISLTKHSQISIKMAVWGLVIGECVSALFCLRYYYRHSHSTFSLPAFRNSHSLLRELIALALPLTSNRIFMNLLQSMETISIPICLQKYGYSNSEALSTYGVLTGMALPCILFPTALTNSLSSMLLPTVAEIQAKNNVLHLKTLIRKVIFLGFGLGFSCGFLFLIFGSFIGSILFDSSLAGDFLKTLAWICPFMYTNSLLISMLNGLGKANTSFFINISGLSLRVLGVWIGIPYFGITGYLWGLLISQLVITLLSVSLLKNMGKSVLTDL